METARLLAKDKRVFVFRGGVWKPRTRPGSFEGVGSIGFKMAAAGKRRNRFAGRNRGGQRTTY